MKAEQRKELERNALAKRISDAGQALKNRPSNGTLIFWGVVLAVVIGVVAFRYFRGKSETSTSARWLALDKITNVDELDGFIKSNAGTPAARTARFEEARYRLEWGVKNLGSRADQAKAIDELKKARDLYGELAGQSKDMPVLVQEAMMGQAKAEEALSVSDAGSLDKAVELYEKLAKDHPDSFQGKAAAARAKEIQEKKADIQKLYQDLAKDAK